MGPHSAGPGACSWLLTWLGCGQEEELIGLFNSADAPEEVRQAVEAVRVVRDRESGRGKGIAFVLLTTKVRPSLAPSDAVGFGI